jgi:hypothetical protein
VAAAARDRDAAARSESRAAAARRLEGRREKARSPKVSAEDRLAARVEAVREHKLARLAMLHVLVSRLQARWRARRLRSGHVLQRAAAAKREGARGASQRRLESRVAEREAGPPPSPRTRLAARVGARKQAHGAAAPAGPGDDDDDARDAAEAEDAFDGEAELFSPYDADFGGDEAREPADEVVVYATHDFDAQGDSEMTMRGGESFLVQMSHLDDESGWIYAVAIDDVEDHDAVARGGYVPIGYLSDPHAPL